jgi:supervillin
VDASIDVKPCDVQLMLKLNTSDPDLELEGSHVGRGSHYYDSEVKVCWYSVPAKT